MGVEEKRRFIINILYYAIIAAIAFFAVKYAYPLLAPFCVALFIAFLLRRPIAFVTKKLHLRRGVAAVLLTALVYATIGTLLVLVVVRLVVSLKEIFWELPALYRTEVAPYLRGLISWLDSTVLHLDPALNSAVRDIITQLIDALGNLISTLSTRAVSIATDYLSLVPGAVMRIVITVVASFFFTIDYPRITGFFLHTLPNKASVLLFDVKDYLCGTLFRILRSYFFIMCITFAELTLGLGILGIKRFALLAALIAILDVFPVLGSGTILLPWAVILFVQGKLGLGIGMLILYAVVFIVRQTVEPRIVGGQVGLHPIIILVGMFVGVQVFGALGLFGVPILISLLRHLYIEGKLPWKQKESSKA